MIFQKGDTIVSTTDHSTCPVCYAFIVKIKEHFDVYHPEWWIAKKKAVRKNG